MSDPEDFDLPDHAEALAPPADAATWPVIYPLYIDARASLGRGRRVRLACAHPNPHPAAIIAALRHLRIPALVEPGKMHPRDHAKYTRVRAQLFNVDSDAWNNDEVRSRRDLWCAVGELVREIQPGMPEYECEVPEFARQMIAMGNAAAREAGVGAEEAGAETGPGAGDGSAASEGGKKKQKPRKVKVVRARK